MKNKQDISALPPTAIDVEQTVLGAMVNDEDAQLVAAQMLKPKYFYAQTHTIIFKAMLGLMDAAVPVDTVTLYEALKKMEMLKAVVGAVYISKLTQQFTPSANIDFVGKGIFLLR